jgi:hypothetical protein
MSTAQSLLAELKHEAVSTRKMLERIPFEKGAWKPHEKSSTLLHLAFEIASQPNMIALIVTQDEVDFAKPGMRPSPPATHAELLARFDENLQKAEAALAGTTDDHLAKSWTVRAGERAIFTGPRTTAIRRMSFSHWIHHRGQLCVYLRLLNIAVPSVYGPSADEKSA